MKAGPNQFSLLPPQPLHLCYCNLSLDDAMLSKESRFLPPLLNSLLSFSQSKRAPVNLQDRSLTLLPYLREPACPSGCLIYRMLLPYFVYSGLT